MSIGLPIRQRCHLVLLHQAIEEITLDVPRPSLGAFAIVIRWRLPLAIVSWLVATELGCAECP